MDLLLRRNFYSLVLVKGVFDDWQIGSESGSGDRHPALTSTAGCCVRLRSERGPLRATNRPQKAPKVSDVGYKSIKNKVKNMLFEDFAYVKCIQALYSEIKRLSSPGGLSSELMGNGNFLFTL